MDPVIKRGNEAAQARPQSDRPSRLSPLSEHIVSDVRVHGVQGLKIDKRSDTAITYCCQRLARKAIENYKNEAEHVKALMEEFQGASRCAIYWGRKEDDRLELRHRLTLSVSDGKNQVDENK